MFSGRKTTFMCTPALTAKSRRVSINFYRSEFENSVTGERGGEREWRSFPVLILVHGHASNLSSQSRLKSENRCQKGGLRSQLTKLMIFFLRVQ